VVTTYVPWLHNLNLYNLPTKCFYMCRTILTKRAIILLYRINELILAMETQRFLETKIERLNIMQKIR
jgi:hypothetical protein